MTDDVSLKTEWSRFKPPFILALDVGTSSTRALLVDARGVVLPESESQYTYQMKTSNEGEVSVDADTLTELVVRTIDEVLHHCGPGAQQIGAVAIDTFWHSLLGVDETNRPTTPVIAWNDTRAVASVGLLRQQFHEQTIRARTGVGFHASYWPAKLLWMAIKQPDVFQQTKYWLSYGDYLLYRLLGRSMTTLSMASGTGLLLTREGCWDEELLRFVRVRPEQLPSLSESQKYIQGLRPEYAQRWPVLKDVPWFLPVGDGAAANVGSGASGVGYWALTIGTSSAMRVVVDPTKVTPPHGLWLYLIDKKRGLLGGALSEGGNLLRWFSETLQLPDLKQADQLAAQLEPDSHGLTILPFLAGERSIGWHSEARMTISGLSLHTTPAMIMRAGAEALAYRLWIVYRYLLLALQVDKPDMPRVLGSGGALLGSKTLQQVIADTLGTNLYLSSDEEASARGAALLALEAMGEIEDVAKVQPHLRDPIHPDLARGKIYRSAALRQEALYHLLFGGGESVPPASIL